MDTLYRIEMLGQMRIVAGEGAITRFGTQKAKALLAYLALHLTQSQSRETLIDLFWPEMDLPAGRDNLSTTLSSLRRMLEPPGIRRGSVLIANHSQVQLNPAAVSVDAVDYERRLDKAQQTTTDAQRVELLSEATALYGGDLLPGVYDDWAVRESERLQARQISALGLLSEALESLGDLPEALRASRRIVAIDPFVEAAQARLITLEMRCGRPGAAREAYESAERLWQDEFGSDAPAGIRAAAQPLISGGSQPGPRPTADRLREAEPAATLQAMNSPTAEPRRPERGARTVPVPLDRFFGRELDIARLAQTLLPQKGDGPETIGLDRRDGPSRLVTLTGPGGMGKTRLAVEFSRQVQDRLNVRCHFVSLVQTVDPERILSTIADALKASGGDHPPLDRIRSFFDDEDAPNAPTPLLILDNLEQLLTSHSRAQTAAAVAALLQAVPYLSCLCTSRHSLGLRGERLIPVEPLPLPNLDKQGTKTAADPAPSKLLAYPSVRLYVDRAQAVRADFGLTPGNADAVADLCRLLDGSPLAIELAASWVRALPPRRMWEKLSRGTIGDQGGGGLESRYADVPERQRSLRAALDWSYRLLAPDQQRLLMRLSVFHGGWDADTAEAVCDEPGAVGLIADLQEASLVVSSGAEEECGGVEARYRFLETIRAYSHDLLARSGDRECFRRRHAEYFRDFAERALPELRGPDQAAWLSRLAADHDNFRAALEFFISSDAEADTSSALRLASALARFWSVRGYWTEARQWLTKALACCAYDACSRERAAALNMLGNFTKLQGDMDEARSLYGRSLAMRRQLGDQKGIAETLHNMGLLELLLDNYDEAEPLYRESLAISQMLGETLCMADELHHLGCLAAYRHDYDRALALFDESLAIRRPLGDLRGIAYSLSKMADVAHEQRDFDRARTLYEETLEIRRGLGDRTGEATSLHGLGLVADAQGDHTAAGELHQQALTIWIALGDRHSAMFCLGQIAGLAHRGGETERAARIAGAVEALSERLGLECPALAVNGPERNAAKQRTVDLLRSGSLDRFRQAVESALA